MADCLGSDARHVRNYVVQLGHGVRFAEPQRRDGLDDLPFSLSNSTFHDFKLCCGSTWIFLVLKAYSKGV